MIEKVVKELYDYGMYGEKIYLENIKKLCDELENPQDKLKTIHIAGTNGKGSTSTTIEKVLLEAGYSVGKYTSPHILKINERISLNGIDISDDDLIKYYYMVKEIILKYKMNPSYFEIMTAMMFKYFADNKVDYLVLETGMGGRFDATNISNSEIAVITNISKDHCEFLGETLEAIAMEKLGIVKKDSTLIIGATNKAIEANIAKMEIKKLIYAQDKYKNSSYKLNFNNFFTEITIGDRKFEYSLFGDYQYHNFITAYTVLKELGIEDDIIEKAAKKVYWQCRFEVLKKEKIIILDGAHNIDGIEKVKSTILKEYTPKDITVITSILKDKDRESMGKLIQEFSNDIILTSLSENKRGSLGEEMLPYFKNDEVKVRVEEDIEKAYLEGMKSDTKIIVICGSFYLLSKFKEVVKI